MASRALARVTAAALAVAALAVAALAVAGCGGDGEPAGASAPPVTQAPAATAPPVATVPTETVAPTTQTETTPAQTAPGDEASPEQQEGGAGDEEAIRVPAVFTFSAGGVTPREVAVPAFFTVQLIGISRDGRPHTLRFQGARLEVPAGGRARASVEGLRAGRYGVEIDGRANAATIVSGAEAGP